MKLYIEKNEGEEEDTIIVLDNDNEKVFEIKGNDFTVTAFNGGMIAERIDDLDDYLDDIEDKLDEDFDENESDLDSAISPSVLAQRFNKISAERDNND